MVRDRAQRTSGDRAADVMRPLLVAVLALGLVVPATPVVARADVSAPDRDEVPTDVPDAAAETALAELAMAAPSPAEADVGDPIASSLLVTFVDGTTPEAAAAVLDGAGVTGKLVDGFTIAVVEVDPTRADDAVTALAAADEVTSVSLDRAVEVRTAAIDPLRPQQWWWRNPASSGRRGGGIDIGAERAWPATRGRSGIVVAVVDTGVDIQHPDLRDNVWENQNVGAFGCANDRNGCNFSAFGSSGQVFTDPNADAHGTHVAGIIAAAEDGAGSVGVAPRVSIMPVKFLHDDRGDIGAAIRAVQYAVDAGAHVINASWSFDGIRNRPEALALDRTLREARIPIVVASGNDGDADREFPASSTAPNVITVTAVDSTGRVPRYANASTRSVDVAAPGHRILSTLPRDHPRGPHGLLDGTSQAAPMVAGAVALAVSETRSTDGARIADAVRRGARPLGSLGDTQRPGGTTRAGLASAPGTLLALDLDVGACRGSAPRAPFGDLARGDVHTPNVDCIVHRGLVAGYPDGTYRPARTVTRGQVASFLAGLVRTSRDLPVPPRGRFRDLDGDVHRDNVEALAAIGIVDGFADGTYRSADRVTRDQFASLLMRSYEHLAQGRARPDGVSFPDVAGSPHERNVRVAAQLGFVEGRANGRFAPREGVTRAQVGSLLRRALDKVVTDGISTP